jgi:glycosyltransferase involved in cell wall biosynthesis
MHRMDEGADVVYGERGVRQGETWFKRATASLVYRLLDEPLVEIEIPRDTGEYRLLSRRVLAVLNATPEHDRFNSRHGELDRPPLDTGPLRSRAATFPSCELAPRVRLRDAVVRPRSEPTHWRN